MQGTYELKGYKILTNELIGQGNNGQVFLCTKIDEPNLKLCAKIINSCQKDLVEAEITVLKKLSDQSKDCPNVVKTYLAEYVEKLDKIVIIMELCESDLEKQIKAKTCFAEPEALKIFKQLVLGYKFIFENSIIHRDLKPANILTQSGVYKIADFGEGKIIDRNKANKLTKRGSPVYQAPELFKSNEYQVEATDKLDVFSLGVLFFEILYGYLPQGKDRNKISILSIEEFFIKLKESKKINFPEEPKVSGETKQLIEQMLMYEPNDRIGWEEIFKHKYFQIIIIIPLARSQIRQPSTFAPSPVIYSPPPVIFTPSIIPQQQQNITPPIIQNNPANLTQTQIYIQPNQGTQNPNAQKGRLQTCLTPNQNGTNSINPIFINQPIINQQQNQGQQIKPITIQQPQNSQIISGQPLNNQGGNPVVGSMIKINQPQSQFNPNINQQSDTSKYYSTIFSWIRDMQRIIEEKCNELLRGQSDDDEIRTNLIKQLGNVTYYYDDEIKSSSQSILRDNQKPLKLKEEIYNNLKRHLQILLYYVTIDSNKKYSTEYRLFNRFLNNLSENKYNFENISLMSQQILLDQNECGRKSQQ